MENACYRIERAIKEHHSAVRDRNAVDEELESQLRLWLGEALEQEMCL